MKKNEQSKTPLKQRFARKCKSLLVLFWSMFKIGLFTFGGGYAMIHLLENEFVAKKKWLTNDEFFDLITIAESTPGPVAINSSTYIGYKTEGFIGSLVATTAMCIPSCVIIFVISLFFNAFLSNKYIAAAFKGIQVCAVFLILCAGIKMAKKIKFNLFNIILFVATFAAMILVSIFNAKFSSIFYILISGGIGLFIYSIGYFKNKLKAKAQVADGIDTAPTIENNQDNTTLDAENIESSENSNTNENTELEEIIIENNTSADSVANNDIIENDTATNDFISDDNLKQNNANDAIINNNFDSEGGAKWFICNYF